MEKGGTERSCLGNNNYGRKFKEEMGYRKLMRHRVRWGNEDV